MIICNLLQECKVGSTSEINLMHHINKDKSHKNKDLIIKQRKIIWQMKCNHKNKKQTVTIRKFPQLNKRYL